MFKNILQSVDWFGLWSIFSMLMFFIFFSIVLIRVVKIDKKFINYMSNMPLDNEEQISK